MLLNCLCVGIGGAIGSVCRYLLGLLPVRPAGGFPLITLGINGWVPSASVCWWR